MFCETQSSTDKSDPPCHTRFGETATPRRVRGAAATDKEAKRRAQYKTRTRTTRPEESPCVKAAGKRKTDPMRDTMEMEVDEEEDEDNDQLLARAIHNETRNSEIYYNAAYSEGTLDELLSWEEELR